MIYELHSPQINLTRKKTYQAKKVLENEVNSITENAKIKVFIPPDLESSELNLEVKIRDLADLSKICDALQGNKAQKNLQKLMDLL